jgi:uncharacterized Ntn-hydrolase superfamily protein
MTYSIVARDERAGQLGVAVQSHFFGVGRLVTWAVPGVGAVATQAFVDPSNGPRGLELMRAGRSAPEAVAAVVAADPGAAQRQAAMIDATGRTAAHTGGDCYAEAGQAHGPGASAQGNMLRSADTPQAMIDAFESTGGDLAGRLLARTAAGRAVAINADLTAFFARLANQGIIPEKL